MRQQNKSKIYNKHLVCLILLYCSRLSNYSEKSLSLTFSSLASTGNIFVFGPPRFHLQQIKTQHNDSAITGPMMAAKIQ